MIEVLWIDDQHKEEEMIQLIIDAENAGIRLNGYTSYEEGFEVLEKDLERFDCILLDGMFFKKKNQEKGTEDTSGIGAAVQHINKLTSKKIFPWFVLSGKDKFTSGTNEFLEINEVACYDKTNPEDVDRLFEDISNASKSLQTFQIRKKYEDVLEVCNDVFLGEAQFPRIFNILKCIEANESIDSHFNGIRMVIERMFERMGVSGLVPDTLVKEGSLNRISLFLSGKHNQFKFNEEYIHPLFAENVFRLLNIIQDGSHDKDNLSLRVHDYLRNKSSRYFQLSVAFLFLDVLTGFLTLVREHPTRENNLGLWTSLEAFNAAEIINMADNGFITLKDLSSAEEISFPDWIVNPEILPMIKIGTKIWYKLKPQSGNNPKKRIETIGLKDHFPE